MTLSTQTQPTCGLYSLKVHTEFCSAHALRDYPGDCRRLHGHNWKVETEVEAKVLDDIGIAIDFKAIKAATRQLADSLDHRFLNDIEPFDRINPSAENLAAWFYGQLSKTLNGNGVSVSAVTLWETRPLQRGGRMTARTIEDIQGRTDTRRIAIDKVGIKDILHPVRVKDKSCGEQHTVASFDMYVNLPHDFKGAHMSRFVEILNSHDREISIASFPVMLQEMLQRLEAESGYIDMRFPYFVEKAAPVSGVRSLLDYQVSFIGEIDSSGCRIKVKIVVPVTSLCLCSKEISERGAHNRRSHVTITVSASAFIWIEELIVLVEAEASSPIYGLLKRPDEKYVTEYAYDHPKFVEDMVRDVAARLDADARIQAYTVESENFESIHNHSAYALIERVK